MKKVVLVLLLFLVHEAQAQKIDLKHDIVYVDKEPLCKFYSIGTITNQAYTVKSLDDEELILIDQSQLRNVEGNALLRFMFADMPQAEAFMPVSFNFRKQMARLLVTYQLVEKGKLVQRNVERFCRNYNGYFQSNRLSSTPPATKGQEPLEVGRSADKAEEPSRREEAMDKETLPVQSPEKESPVTDIADTRDRDYDYPIVERDAEQEVFLSGTMLRQDFKDIGSYSADATTVGGKDGYIVAIKDINGIKIAVATFVTGEGECDLVTQKDQKSRRVTIPKSDLYTIVKDLVSKLSFLLYI